MTTKLIPRHHLIFIITFIVLNFPLLINTQSAVCPIGFVWGGRKFIKKLLKKIFLGVLVRLKVKNQPILVLDPEQDRSPGLQTPGPSIFISFDFKLIFY